MSDERPSPSFLELAGRSNGELEALVRTGERPDQQALAGCEYRGINTRPALRSLGLRKFIKGFELDDAGSSVGYNVRVQQNSPDEPWFALPSERAPRRFGYFGVTAVVPGSRHRRYPNALLLDYSAARNPVHDISRLLRDYLVRANVGSDDLLLGKAYVAVGPLTAAVTYFVLERLRQSRP